MMYVDVLGLYKRTAMVAARKYFDAVWLEKTLFEVSKRR